MSSQASQIRDAALDLLKGEPGYKTFRTVQSRQLQPDDLPALTVLRGDEVSEADGDANAGPPHFVKDVTLHVSIVRGFNDPAVLDSLVDDDMDAIEEHLLSHPTFNMMFDGVTEVRRTTSVPQAGETYFYEMRLSLTFQFRTSFSPNIGDDFGSVQVDVRSARHCDPDSAVSFEFDVPTS